MHDYHQATAAGNPPRAAAATPSRPSDDRQDAEGLAMDLFVDLASGWTSWVPRWPNGAEPAAEEGLSAAAQHPRRQGLVVGLLGRVGAWFGMCEPSPSGGWRRVHVPRRDPWEPGARCTRSVWSWRC